MRGEIGDAAFFGVLRGFARRFRHQSVTTADFETLIGEVTGRRLDAFFDAWLRRPALPPLGG